MGVTGLRMVRHPPLGFLPNLLVVNRNTISDVLFISKNLLEAVRFSSMYFSLKALGGTLQCSQISVHTQCHLPI